MSLTLLEAAKGSEDPGVVAVIRELALGEIAGRLPFRTVNGGGLDYMVESDLPNVGFRGINEAFDPSVGVMNPQYERLKPMGGDLDIDLFVLRTQGDAVRAQQIEQYARAMRFKMEDYFINGDSSVEPRAVDGLRARINTGSSQAINAGGALTMSLLDELADAVEAPGAQKVLIMNKKMRRRITQYLRSASLPIQTDRDEFGRIQMMHNDMPILVTDTNGYGAQIQPFTESGSSTSVYCVAFGDTFVTGLQGPAGLQIRQLGEVPDAPVDRTRLEWDFGMAVLNGRAAARIYGVTDVAVTA